ncbi:leukotriene B4 receptor 1-like [Sardina pilchardus]|uniref:leukotriene B4 receptor 1-like n=1 Tax=Sardina pilchardus TaxID=27697 RepID=UPI002E164DA1
MGSTMEPNFNHSTSCGMELNTTTLSPSGGKGVIPVVVLGLCAVVGLPSNIAVIITIVRNITGQNMSFTLKLMLCLSVCDTLSLLSIPVWIYALLKGWPLGDGGCKLFSYLVYWSLYASVLIVTSMSVHHHNIMKAKRANRQLMERLQRRRKHIWLVAIWILAGVLALPVIPTRGVMSKNDGRLRCQNVVEDGQKVSILLYEVLFGFAIPFSALVTSYLCLYKKVPKANLLSKQRMTRLVVSIVVVFFLFWMPTHIINIVDIVAALTKNSNCEKYKQAKNVRRMAGDVAKTLSYMNCCLDPFLYAFASRSFLSRGRRSTKKERVQISYTQENCSKTEQSKAEATIEAQII